MKTELEKYHENLDNQARLEHRDVLLAIGAIIKTKEGQTLFKYLFKSLDVAKLPEPELDGKILHEYLGFLRAGNSIYKLACEADAEIAASILAKIERERYNDLIEQYRIEQGYESGNDNYE